MASEIPLPSALLYTIQNAGENQSSTAICATIAEDSTVIAVGFSDSTIRVWPLTPVPLTQLKPADQLEELDKKADDILIKMIDDKETFDKKVLIGHAGPVYSVNISISKQLILSSSEDGTIRLWSLKTWTNVCVYRSHYRPVWNVKFCPHAYYFVSCSNDKTARLWSTEHHQPLRMLLGHQDDVECAEFHPKSKYIATGSSDNTVKVWSLKDGNCIKTFEGHKARVTSLAFSNDGKFIVSGGIDKKIMIWEHTSGHKLADLEYHTDKITSICFSRCGNILMTGGLDNTINIWDFSKFVAEVNVDELNTYSTPNVYEVPKALILASYKTKKTPLLCLHFTKRNLILAAGFYQSSKHN